MWLIDTLMTITDIVIDETKVVIDKKDENI